VPALPQAVIESVLSPEQVAAFRTDITASVHPPGELPEAARLALQPSIETIASQQRLLEHPDGWRCSAGCWTWQRMIRARA
jgi:hypothetical protein